MKSFFQIPLLEATFGGGEANVAVGLARFGLEVAYISVIPDNPIGNACIREFKKHNVNTSEFAVAASCLMHSIPGDLPLISVEEVKSLTEESGSGRVQR